jgi:hypothetical protein
LGWENDFDFTDLIAQINKNYPISSSRLITALVLKSFSTQNPMSACLILIKFTDSENTSKETVSIFETSGVIDELLNLFKLENSMYNFFVLEYFSFIFKHLIELNKENVIKIILDECMKIVRKPVDSISNKSMYHVITIITTLSKSKKKVDLSPVDFREIFEFIFNHEDSSFIHFASVLVEHQKNVDKSVIKRAVERSIEILKSDQVIEMRNPYSYFEQFIKFMKYEFSPYKVFTFNWLTQKS